MEGIFIILENLWCTLNRVICLNIQKEMYVRGEVKLAATMKPKVWKPKRNPHIFCVFRSLAIEPYF